MNEAAKCITGQVLKDMVILEGSSIGMAEPECSIAVYSENLSSIDAFQRSSVVWPATQCIDRSFDAPTLD
jgi:hypothetical protein